MGQSVPRRYEWRSVVRLRGSRPLAGETFERREHAEEDAERWTQVPFSANPERIFIQRREVGEWEDE